MTEGVDPSQFYTGLVADLYSPLRGHVPDPALYEPFIRQSGEPALELGCGAGDPLLDLRSAGLDVEGLDSSADMLDRCRRRAADAGIDVVLHHQAVESMALGRRYRTIFLAGATFNLLIGDDVVAAALARIRAHLEPDGSVLIPLFTPQPVPAEHLGQWKEQVLHDGTVIRVAPVSSVAEGRLHTTVLRYERVGPDGSVESLERPWLLFEHSREGFASLVQEAGLVVDDLFETGGDGFAFVLSAGAA